MKNLLIILFSPAIIFLLYDIFFNFIPIYKNNYTHIDNEIIIFIMLCNFISIISFIYFYSKVKKMRISNSLIHVSYIRKIPIQFYYFSLIIIITLLHYLIYFVFEQINYIEVIENYARFYALSKRGSAWVFVLIFAVLFILLIDFYKSGFNSHKFNIFLIMLLLVSLTGGRSIVVVFLIFSIYLIVVFNNYKFHLAKFILILILSSIIFFGNAILRSDSIDNYLSSKETHQLDFDNAFVLNDVLALHYSTNNKPFLLFLEDLYYLLIPRALMPDKPYSTAETRLIYPEVADRGTNFTFGIYANSFVNIGELTLLILPIFYIYLNYIYIKYVFFRHSKNFTSFVIIFFLFFSIQFARGGIFNVRLFFVFLSIFLAYGIYSIILNIKIR